MASASSSAAPIVPGSTGAAPMPMGAQPEPRAPPPSAPSGPRVMIDAATGQLVVDEASLEQQAQYVNHETVGQVVQEERHASYSSYTKRSASRTWTVAETEVFYRCVSRGVNKGSMHNLCACLVLSLGVNAQSLFLSCVVSGDQCTFVVLVSRCL